jgi:hypothetical protein
MTLVVQIIVGSIKVASSLVLFGLTVATDGATTIVQIITLAFEQGQSIANLI